VNTLGPGDYFGEIALIHESPRTATVRAVDEVDVWILSRDDFDDLLRRYFDLAGTLARTARLRAASTRDHLERGGQRRVGGLRSAESESSRD
jgi:CRP-like cAMP-binding protein